MPVPPAVQMQRFEVMDESVSALNSMQALPGAIVIALLEMVAPATVAPLIADNAEPLKRQP